VIVSIELEIGVLDDVVMVNVAGVPGAMLAGEKDAVDPVGSPLIASPTEPAKLFTAAALIV
jgi:hypothetical protein